MKNILTFILTILLALNGQAQTEHLEKHYEDAYEELKGMLEGEAPLSFKRAVFVSENAYMENLMDYKHFSEQIALLVHFAKKVAENGDLQYAENDINDVQKKFAAYRIMKDSVPVSIQVNADSVLTLYTQPFSYDFDDFFGEEDWTKMFVSKLLATHTGNCHSLPFLYKIIAEELGTQAHLAMAPNHTYIKQWTDKTGWFNTELTSGQFPIDAWIMASGYIKLEAIQNRLYMDTLSQKQSIAVTLTDLAHGFQNKFGYQHNKDFVLKCIETALEYYPHYSNALIMRAELFKSNFEDMVSKRYADSPTDLFSDPAAKKLFDDVETQYAHIHKLGYRQMPREMYLNWLMDIEEKDTDKGLERYTFEAPQPFKEYGHKVKVTTLSQGKYQEFFDTDTVTQIGSVVFNRLSNQITHFIEYDTVYSEATLEPEVISRWLQQDPLASERYDWSPYNFVRNNPILYVDPDGMLDDYYDSYGNYLGSDGEGDNIRLVADGQEQAVSGLLNGDQTTASNRATARQSGNSAVITIDNEGIQSMLQSVGDNTLTSGNEHSMVLLLDVYSDNPTITAAAGPTGNNEETTLEYVSDNGAAFDQATGFLIIGQAHGHPPTNDPNKVNVSGTSTQDQTTAQNSGVAIYAIDAYSGSSGRSFTVSRANPNPQRSRDRQTRNVGRTGGSFNIARDALEITGGKRNR